VRRDDIGDPPFAAPLRAVDEISVSQSDAGFQLRAVKRIDVDDDHQRAHFPSLVIYPGVFIIETLLQATAVALADSGASPEIREVRSVRFLAPLFANDTLTLTATVRHAPHGTLDVDAACHRGDGRLAARLKVLMWRGEVGDA
jgi:3-hydroxyacyl-[acyl-carrier-protein] dehydratase